MHFDLSINLGNILTVIIIIGSLIAFHRANVEKLAKIEVKVDAMWKRYTGQD